MEKNNAATPRTDAPNGASTKLPVEASADYSSIPVTGVREVEESPYRPEIFSMIASGFSPARTLRNLERAYGASVPLEALERYKQALPQTCFLPAGYLRERLKNIDVQVDVIGEMARMLVVVRERLETVLELQSLTVDKDERLTLEPLVEKQTKVYWRMLQDYLKARQSLGELPSKPLEAHVSITTETKLPTLREIEEMKEDMRRRLEASDPRKMLLPPDDAASDVPDGVVLDALWESDSLEEEDMDTHSRACMDECADAGVSDLQVNEL